MGKWKSEKVGSRRKLVSEMEEKIDESKDVEDEDEIVNAEEYQSNEKRQEVDIHEQVCKALGDLETGMSLMMSFQNEKNENVDYYTIGKVASQSFALMKEKLLKMKGN